MSAVPQAQAGGPDDLVFAVSPKPCGFWERPWIADWLRLRPRNLVAGMGYHKGTSEKDLIQHAGLSRLSLQAYATIEAKKEAPGLHIAARSLGVEFLWLTAQELEAMPAPNPFPRVAPHLGVVSVSEAAALKGGAELIVPKATSTTLAVARVA